MRFYLGVLLSLCFAAAMLPAKVAAQDGAGTQSDWLFGYFDPRTNVFTAEAPAADAVAVDTNIGGTLRIEITFQIRSGIPQSVSFDSGATISVLSGRHSGSTRGKAKITRSGNVGKAVITLPYLFLAAPTAKMSVAVFVGANQPAGQFTQLVRNIPLPAPGANTVLKIDAAL